MTVSHRNALFHAFIVAGCIAVPGYAASADEPTPADVLSMSLQQLTNLEVTSVSKKSEKANEAAAAVYVLTAEDIRRLGATSVPEALRVVPGLDVAQAGSGQWAVSARGFNNQFANNLLVLIDGRTVYTPLFSGVFWDVQDVVLDDIERIEVIRGPGATLWGANAVNGVINIITKNAKDTQGTLASFTAGSHDKELATLREGVKVDENTYARVYAKFDDRDAFATPQGPSAHDEWRKKQAGFHADSTPTSADTVTLQGDVYASYANNIANLPSIFMPPAVPTLTTSQGYGANLLSRWNHKLGNNDEFTIQAYYDDAKLSNAVLKNDIQTADFDFQYNLAPIDRHEITWGAGYRSIWSAVTDTPYYSQVFANTHNNLYSAFVQDKISLVSNELFLTLGSKFEKNDYTGFEFEPTGRLTWLINDKQTFWSAVSRAVQTPFINSAYGQLIASDFPPGGPPLGFVGGLGNRNLQSQELIAYEAGYRIQPTKSLSFDLATFYNDYSRVYHTSLGTPFINTPFGVPSLYVPAIADNNNAAHSYGFELASEWDVTSYWKLKGSYSYIDLHFMQADPFGFSRVGTSPQTQYNVQSLLLLPHDVEMDNVLYYVSTLPSLNIPSYFRFDTRLAWKVVDNVELSLVGQNLLQAQHKEFSGFLYQPTVEIPRAVYANVRWNF